MNKITVVIPCYNNVRTIYDTVSSAMRYSDSVIVVLDGCNDGSEEALAPLKNEITILSYQPNRGKGNALRIAFDYAQKMGFDYVVTMDADGQHYASDLPSFFNAVDSEYGSMVVGCRYLKQENMPSGNTFANKFSNFWFKIQTGVSLSDTQTGFRAYPLFKMKGMRPFTKRYEAELELLVRLAWRNIAFTSIPIKVFYAPKGVQISHFRKGRDFFRISLLNTLLCLISIIYGYPSKLLRKL